VAWGFSESSVVCADNQDGKIRHVRAGRIHNDS
jgi:hypothetical protein